MVSVRKRLGELLDDERQIFVFPSEVAAEFWRHESLKLSSRRAIWEDRFLSWDRFKEQTFELSGRAAPVNHAIRTLFAADLLRLNSRHEPILSSLVNPSYAESSLAFLRTLTSLLPELARYRDLVAKHRRGENRAATAIDVNTAADLDHLWERYQSFMSANGLFEPSYDQIDVSRLSNDYHVFFPEVLEDWKEAQQYLDFRRIHPVAAGGGPAAAIRRYENSVQELGALFFELSMLLEDGVDLADIAITVPRLEAWESLLRRDAGLAGIPLDIRQGHPLSEYPEIRLFDRLLECNASGFSLETLKSLFYSRAYPWRHRGEGEELVRWGIEHHCAANYRSKGAVRDVWGEKLEGAGRGDDGAAAHARSLLRFYHAFRRGIVDFVGAKSFPALRTRLQGFVNTWLDTSLWSQESLRVFQFALDALNDLVDAQGRVSGISVTDPYSLWLGMLGERLYVPRGGTEGIPVYPYRVSAGIEPAHHFILGATQAGTQVDWRPLSFLREDERQGLGIEDVSASEEFLDLYLRSGERVQVSFSDQDVSGIELPPGYFVLRDAVERPGNPDEPRPVDSYAHEMTVWSEGGAPPQRIHRRQQEGARFYGRVGAGRREADITRARLDEEGVSRKITSRLTDEAGRAQISPTRLERYWECPFAFLFSTVLGVEERSYGIEWSDPRRIGSLMHEILKGLFETIAGRDRRFDPLHLEEYRGVLSETVSTVFGEREQAGEAFVPPVWNTLRPHLLEQLSRFLDAEAERFGGFTVEALEADYSLTRDSVALRGRIDRVSSGDDGLLLIDYKRHNRVRKPDLLGRASADPADSEVGKQPKGDGPPSVAATASEAVRGAAPAAGPPEGVRPLPPVQPPGVRPTSFQIPFYVMLLEELGQRVSKAAYYDIEAAKHQLVFDADGSKAWFDRGELERLLESTEAAVQAMSLRVRQGDWTVPDPRSGCEDCSLRAVCRMKYTVR